MKNSGPTNPGTKDTGTKETDVKDSGMNAAANHPGMGNLRRIAIVIVGIFLATAAATTAAAQAPVDDYESNLDMIQAQSARNRNHDSSPYRDVPQADLDVSTGGGLIDTDRAAYLGNPNGNPEQSFPTVAGGQFRTSCEFSHFAYDDPLLFPNQPGRAHLHMFFGNTDVNAYSTYDTLANSGSSTCNGQEANRSGYWVPAMIDGDGMVRIPERIVAYYKGYGLANGECPNCGPQQGSRPYEPGMANIAPMGITVPEVADYNGGQVNQVNYKCSNNFSAVRFDGGVDEIPNCDGDYYSENFNSLYPVNRTVLEMEVKFWNCYDPSGPDGDWRNWKPSGLTRGSWFYSNCNGYGGQVDAIAPPLGDKEIYPNIVYYVNYVVEPGDDTSDWFLSSDVDSSTLRDATPSFVGPRGSTHHGDWWGGWHPEINEEFLDNCVNFRNPAALAGCGMGYLSDGGPDNTNPLPGRALKYRPQYDTVGDGASYKTSLATIFDELCVPLGPLHEYTNGRSPRKGALCVPDGGHGFACEVDAGTVSWTSVDASKYWVYRSVDGGATYTWLGRTTGSPAPTTFDDPRPTIGATYQVHYEGIPRVECTIDSEPPTNNQPLTCQANGGALTWIDQGVDKYWVYRSVDGGATYTWLGRTAGSPAPTTFTDNNPPAGATYQVHHAGVPRVDCT